MNVAPRRKLRLPTPLLALCLAFAPQTLAQNATGARQSPARKAGAAARQKADAGERARLARERRDAAAALLEVAADARTLPDNLRAAEIQTAAADALWPHDEQSARSLFRRAWDAALAPSPERDAASGERPERSPYSDLAARYREARQTVLPTVARRDARLADSFMREVTKALSEAAAEGEADEYAEQGMGFAGWQRLAVADALLDEGEPQRAAEVAAPLVEEFVSQALVEFLLKLRLQAAPEADRLYLRLLERARARPSTDANDVLLLSALVASPTFMMGVDENGSVYINSVKYDFADDPRAAPPVAPQLRAAFFETAAAVLLRQSFNAGGRGEDEMRRVYSLYFTLGRLLPFFERESPRRAAELRARLNALSQEVDAARRDALSREMGYSEVYSRTVDVLGGMAEDLARAHTDAERDLKRLTYVGHAAGHRMWDRARRIADEITDAGRRSVAHMMIAVRQLADIESAYSDDDDDDFERAARFVAAAQAPPLARAAGMAQAASLAARRGKRQRAAELMGEAAGYAEQVERGTLMRAVAFAAVAAHAFRSSDARSWEALSSFVSAANVVEGYTGDEYKFPDTEESPSAPREVLSEMDGILVSYRLEDVFGAAARADASRALVEARALQGREARAFATIAAARVALERPAAARRP